MSLGTGALKVKQETEHLSHSKQVSIIIIINY